MSEAPAAPRPVSADHTHPAGLDLLLVPPRARTGWRVLPARVGAMCVVELQKLRHDRTELYTRAVQPALWLLIFGETFTRIRAIPTGGIPYLDYLAPGIIAQSAMFIAIFYGIMIIWERDAGILTKLLVTPTPRAALITGKAFAAGVKALIQAIVVVVIAALLARPAQDQQHLEHQMADPALLLDRPPQDVLQPVGRPLQPSEGQDQLVVRRVLRRRDLRLISH